MTQVSNRDVINTLLETVNSIASRTNVPSQEEGVFLQGLAACLEVLLTDERERRAVRAQLREMQRDEIADAIARPRYRPQSSTHEQFLSPAQVKGKP